MTTNSQASRRPSSRSPEAATNVERACGVAVNKPNATSPLRGAGSRHRHERLTRAHVPCLLQYLTTRDLELLRHLATIRVASAQQLRRLCFTSSTPLANVRQANRALHRLTDHGFLMRLPRRQGGIQAGSDTALYVLGRAGHLVTDPTKARRPTTINVGWRYLAHQLAVAELYVQLHETARTGRCEVLRFLPEPDCWQRYADLEGQTTLKPDAFVRLGLGDWELHRFIEVDRGTVSVGTIRRQLAAYVRFATNSRDDTDIVPAVVWLTPHDHRRRDVDRLVKRVVAEPLRPLFRTGLLTEPIDVLLA